MFAPLAAGSPDADHVAFGMVATDTFRLAAYDVFGATGGPGGTGAASRRANGLTHTESFFVLLNGDSLDELTDLWTKLAQDATVIQALALASWAPAYGMLTDRFGITWVFGLTPTA